MDIKLMLMLTHIGRAKPIAIWVATTCALLAGPSCGNDASSVASSSTGSQALTDTYAVVPEGSQWMLVGRNTYSDDQPLDVATDVLAESIEWSADYVRTTELSSGSLDVDSVNLGRYHLGLDSASGVFRSARFEFDPARVAGMDGLVGAPIREEGGGPHVVVLADGDDSVVVTLSYDLDAQRLTEWTDSLRFVSEDEWLAVPVRAR